MPPTGLWDKGVRTIYGDSETTGLDWYGKAKMIGWSMCLPDGTGGYYPWGHSSQNLDPDRMREWMEYELRGMHIKFFNAAFDIHNSYNFGVDFESMGCTVSDLGHTIALLDDRRRNNNLEDVAQDVLREGKVQGLDKTRMADYAGGDVFDYAFQDTHLLWRMDPILQKMIDDQDLRRVHNLEDECIFATCEMERNASPIDGVLLKEWRDRAEREYLQTLWALRKASGMTVNPKSVPDKIAMFRKLGIPLQYDTQPKGPREGKVSFDKRYIGHIDHEAVKLLRRAIRLQGMKSKYLDPYWECFQKYGKIIYAFHQLRASSDDGGDSGTGSGRYSSSGYGNGDGVNMQQVSGKKHEHSVKEEVDWPYKPRRLFVSAPGQVYWAGDAEQIEYRWFCHYAQPPMAMAAYAADPWTNFHKSTQMMIEKYQEITYELTKDCNFAGLFGAGQAKFAWMLGMDVMKARSLYRVYHKALPEASKLLKYVMSVAEKRGYVRTILGDRKSVV